MTALVLAGFVLVLTLAWSAVVVAQSANRPALDQRERGELVALRALVDDLKDTAWDHRELDSALATIMLDKIRTYERRRREDGS